jgi:hypothetical protein
MQAGLAPLYQASTNMDDAKSLSIWQNGSMKACGIRISSYENLSSDNLQTGNSDWISRLLLGTICRIFAVTGAVQQGINVAANQTRSVRP